MGKKKLFLPFKWMLALIMAVYTLAVCATMVVNTLAEEAMLPVRQRFDHPPYIVIVIDDFGQDRRGVQEMLELPVPITAAIMPFMEFTKEDAQMAVDNGNEVIIHMPMQSSYNDPLKWYGPNPILIKHTREDAERITREACEDVPNAVGINVHVGGKSTESVEIVTGVMNTCIEYNYFFLDSFTSMNSVCRKVAYDVGVPFLRRQVFLEHGNNTEQGVKKQLKKAADIALKKGSCVVIGHVGPEGGLSTVRGISAMLSYFEENGIEVVPASKLLE